MYLDANFFIYSRFDLGKSGKQARTLLKEITKGKSAITSALTLDEVMWVLKRQGQKEIMRQVIKDIYSMKNLEVKQVSPLIPLRALDFIEENNLKPRDAFHLAVMEEFGQSEIVSNDSDFDKITWIKRIKV